MECVIRYDKLMDNGLEKKVNEKYVVDALTFTEAEKRIIEEMSSYISGSFDVMNITPCPFGEVFLSDSDSADKWYRAKLSFVSFDETKGKEKKVRVCYLIQSCSFDGAKKSIEEFMSGSISDYVIEELKETQYVDVFIHGNNE